MAVSSYPKTCRVGVFVFDDFEPLDVWGFIEAFSIARFIGSSYADAAPRPFEIILIAESTAPVRSYNGPRVVPDLSCDEALSADAPVDLFMIPGGRGVRPLLEGEGEGAAARRAEVFDWIRAMDARAQITSSVCTGAAVLAAAGLLDGLPATTNQASFEWVVGFGPRVRWDEHSRWVDAGHLVTSAGVSAGTDMAFYLVARLAGRAVAERAARAAEYAWQRDPDAPIHYPD